MRTLLAGLVVAAVAVSGCGSAGDPDPDVRVPPAEPVWCPEDAPVGAPVLDDTTSKQRFDARRLIGLDEEEAQRLSARHGCAVRVVIRDGDHLAVTNDFSWQRINVEVEGDVVVAIDGIS